MLGDGSHVSQAYGCWVVHIHLGGEREDPGVLCYLLPWREAQSTSANYWVPLDGGFWLAHLVSIPIATENDLSSEESLYKQSVINFYT